VIHRLDVELIQHIPPRARLLLLPPPLRLFHSAQVVGRIHISHVPASDLLRLEAFPVGATRQVTLFFRQPRAVVRVCDRGYGFVGESKGVPSGHWGDGRSVRGSLVLGLDGRVRGASRLEGFFRTLVSETFLRAQLEICVDIPAIAPTADCCWRGLAGETNVRRHSRHMLAGRSDSLVIARSSDIAAVWLSVRWIASLCNHSSNPLHLSHVASQPIVRTPAPRIVRRQEATTSRFIIVQHKQYEAILSCKCSVHTFSTLYNTWLFRTHHNQYLLSQLAPCRLTSHARCSDASLRTNQ